MIQVFSKYGFEVKDGTDIEDDWYNFTAVNIDEDHPARQMHDTFYLKKTSDKTKLLRTQNLSYSDKNDAQWQTSLSFYSSWQSLSGRLEYDLHTNVSSNRRISDKNIHMGHLQ